MTAPQRGEVAPPKNPAGVGQKHSCLRISLSRSHCICVECCVRARTMSSLLLQRLRVSVASCALPRSGSSYFFSTAAAAAVSSSSSSASPAPGMTPLRLLKPLPKPAKPQAKNKAMATVIAERLIRDKNTRERAAANNELAARVAALPKVVTVAHDLPPAAAAAPADAAAGAAAAAPDAAAAANSSSARFAIIVCGGTQHRVCVGDLIMPNKIHEAIGHEMTFHPLLVGRCGFFFYGDLACLILVVLALECVSFVSPLTAPSALLISWCISPL